MFTVYHSNQLDLLSILIARIIKQHPLASPLSEELVLVQSPGMAQWLQMALASELGIAANISFPLPATFIWEMFIRVLPDIPGESAFSKSAMCWKLMAVLPEMLSQPAFRQLNHYLKDDDCQRKLFQLAARIADLFDQYLVYRPDWINAWQAGRRVESAVFSDHQEWQAQLWSRLVDYTAALKQPEWHRANLFTRFIQRLEQSTNRPVGLPERVFICGISALPPIYLQALKALGRHIDIHLMFTNPCRDYWGDIQDYAFFARLRKRHRHHYLSHQPIPQFRCPDTADSLFNAAGEQNLSNPLLASWGKPGRDNLFLLAALEINEVTAFTDIDPENLLKSLQHDVLELEDHAVFGMDAVSLENSRNKRVLLREDRSFSLNACHSPQREVEVLQDYLLQLMARERDLSTRDIIVMVADIDTYTPFIQAVFGNAPEDRFLPYAISDRLVRYAHPIIPAFLTLLRLPESRFTSEEILALLEVPALASHFSIDAADLKRLRLWVEESGIRWGLDDSAVGELDLPNDGQHTWQFGLKRMLLGYAMESDSGEWQGVLPYDESSGLIAELAGNLACLLERLTYWRTCLKQPRNLNDWQLICTMLLNDFFDSDAESEEVIILIETQWQKAISYGLQAHFSTSVPISLLHDDLVNRLDQQRISQRFFAGAINFCTLMPMRSIPFKVVCLLGMNEGVYPRTLQPLGFDLMIQQPRRGDRSRRDEDRYLFLEALLSAQQWLYISYIGRNIHDNSQRFPSVIVSELMEYIAQSFAIEGDSELDPDESGQRVLQHLCYFHSRTPFDPRNFLPDAPWPGYASEWLPAARASGKAHPSFVQRLTSRASPVITLEQFLGFWRHPVRAFFEQRLGVRFYSEETELPDAELFTFDDLERFQLNMELLGTLISAGDIKSVYSRYRAAGKLPYGAFGELLWQGQLAEMQLLAESASADCQRFSQQEVNIRAGGNQLSGWLHQVQPDGLLRWRPARCNLFYGLNLWLEHLIWCASGGQGFSRMYSGDGTTWCFLAVDPELARSELERYVLGYQDGMTRPLLLTNSGADWLKTSFDNTGQTLQTDERIQARAVKKFLQRWQGDKQIDGERNDPYLWRLTQNSDENLFEEMTHQAKEWLLPMLKANVSLDEVKISKAPPG